MSRGRTGVAVETREELYYDKASVLDNGDAGSGRSRRIWNWMRPIAKTARGFRDGNPRKTEELGNGRWPCSESHFI